MYWKQLNLQAHLRRRLLPFPKRKVKFLILKLQSKKLKPKLEWRTSSSRAFASYVLRTFAACVGLHGMRRRIHQRP
ncbi:hypothetical protein ACJX0J_041687, partial [Zea mays]